MQIMPKWSMIKQRASGRKDGYARISGLADICERPHIISEGMKYMDERTRIRSSLVRAIAEMGYPEAFGMAVADNLRTEKMMSRMIGYLRSAKPRSAEEIADEMLAIMEDRERWIRKKSAEYYNSKYNEFLYYGFGENPDEEQDAD